MKSLVLYSIMNMLTCIFITKYLIVFLNERNIVDHPGAIKMHLRPVPRGGGIALVISFIIWFAIYTKTTFGYSGSGIILTLYIILSVVSLIDDISHVHPLVRLIVHIITCTLFILLGKHGAILLEEVPIWLDNLISITALIAFINIYNFLDGIDGISAAQSIHLSITILALCYFKGDIIIQKDLIVTIASLVLGGSLVFLYFNRPPARIFLGDVGSISLGFLLGICLFFIACSSKKLLVSSIISVLYYIADGACTIIYRFVNGEKVWLPHLKHFFQCAIKNGMSPKRVLMKIVGCNVLLMILAITASKYPILSFCLSVMLVIALLSKFSYTKPS